MLAPVRFDALVAGWHPFMRLCNGNFRVAAPIPVSRRPASSISSQRAAPRGIIQVRLILA